MRLQNRNCNVCKDDWTQKYVFILSTSISGHLFRVQDKGQFTTRKQNMNFIDTYLFIAKTESLNKHILWAE